MKPDALKKNLFWILSGVGLFLTFLVFVMVNVSVGGEVSKKADEIKKELDGAKATPKGTKAIADMAKQDEVIAKVKEDLWKKNWEKQLDLFRWPADRDGALARFQARYQKFGENIVEQNSEFDTLKRPDVYQAAYDRLADGVKPTQFAGGSWRAVLRHVSDWTARKPSVAQVWLALEDLWVQTAVLEPVKAINAAAGTFVPVDDGANPVKRTFRSRVWEVELEVPKDGPDADKYVKVKLTNRTNRLQPFGTAGRMRALKLNVWLSESGPPVDLRIQGDALEAGGVLDVPVNPALVGIDPGVAVTKITRVEVVPDPRTVPVRRIDVVELGKVDARHAAAALKPPTKGVFATLAEEAAAAAAPADGMGGPGGPPGAGRPGDMAGMMGRAMGGAGGAAGGKAGDPTAVLDTNLNRYIDVTDQVRRMPVGVVLLLDQMYLQDALAAYSNSALRFQVTQAHWQRFRGTLDTPGAADPADGTGGYGGGGDDGSGGAPDEASGRRGPGRVGEAGRPGAFGPPGAGRPGAFGSSSGPGAFGGPPGAGRPGAFGSSSGPGGMSRPGGFSVPGGGYGGYTGSGGLGSPGAVTSEAEAASGLVELSLYGIVTLYEKYEDPAAAAPDAAATPAAPAK